LLVIPGVNVLSRLGRADSFHNFLRRG
jgi:hypothetical protein